MPKIDKSSLFSQISGKKLTINIVSSLLPLILKPGPTQINIKNGHDEKSNFSTKAFRQTRIRSFIIWSEQILAFPWIKLLDIFLAFALIFFGLTALCFPAIGLLVLVFMLPPLLKREDSPESADKRRVQLSSENKDQIPRLKKTDIFWGGFKPNKDFGENNPKNDNLPESI